MADRDVSQFGMDDERINELIEMASVIGSEQGPKPDDVAGREIARIGDALRATPPPAPSAELAQFFGDTSSRGLVGLSSIATTPESQRFVDSDSGVTRVDFTEEADSHALGRLRSNQRRSARVGARAALLVAAALAILGGVRTTGLVEFGTDDPGVGVMIASPGADRFDDSAIYVPAGEGGEVGILFESGDLSQVHATPTLGWTAEVLTAAANKVVLEFRSTTADDIVVVELEPGDQEVTVEVLGPDGVLSETAVSADSSTAEPTPVVVPATPDALDSPGADATGGDRVPSDPPAIVSPPVSASVDDQPSVAPSSVLEPSLPPTSNSPDDGLTPAQAPLPFPTVSRPGIGFPDDPVQVESGEADPTVPTVPVPTVLVPTGTVPVMPVPTVTVPTVTVPVMPVPTVTVPTVTVPVMPVPTVTVPTVTVPTVPIAPTTFPIVPTPVFPTPVNVVPDPALFEPPLFPTVTVPTVTVPTVTVPATGLPGFEVPTFTVPPFPS